MVFDDHNEEEEEDRRPSSSIPIPLSLSFPAIAKKPAAVAAASRYMECLKNHAARIGGHALDGCREFMPAGSEGSMEALTCAACNCHRNFHRKEAVDPTPDQPIQFPTFPCYNYQQQQQRAHHPAALFRFYPYGKARPPGGKRFRTKFTEEQKERMKELAERVGWRLRKEDEAAVRRFCQETGVSRRVLKVWMHNHKQTLGKKLAPALLN